VSSNLTPSAYLSMSYKQTNAIKSYFVAHFSYIIKALWIIFANHNSVRYYAQWQYFK
jgi:hypothetical protein